MKYEIFPNIKYPEWSKIIEITATIFNINALSVIDICRLSVKYLRETEGRIVNISSVAAPVAIPFQACYSATKSAVETFSKAFASEVKPFKIKVTCVRPGDTKTGFTDARIKNEKESKEYQNRVRNSVEKMEKDERNGVSPIKVSKVIYKVINRKRPPLTVAVGFSYKLICGLAKFLPEKLTNYLVSKLYG